MKTFVSVLAACAMVSPLFAGDGKDFKATKQVTPVDTCLYRDQEFQIDTFYSGWIGSRGSHLGTGSGGGFDLNYFFCKYVGVGYEFQAYDNRSKGEIAPLAGNLFLRYPICSINLAPYVLVGGGGAWDTQGGKGIGYGNVGAGLEYRFTSHIGIFVDGRYVYGGSGNVANIRSGLRIAF